MFANGKAIELFIVFDTKLVLFPHKFFAPHIVDFLLDFFSSGETIKIIRRSRTGPHPGLAAVSGNNSISKEDLPPPDAPAASKEATNK